MILRFGQISILALIVVALILPNTSSATTAVLYVSPPSGRVPAGSIIPVQVRVNSGADTVNAIQANLNYDSSQLAYQSLAANGTAFSLVANTQIAARSIKIARATGGGEKPVKGDNLIITVLFKAITTAGTASVSIGPDSHVVRSTDSLDILVGAPSAKGARESSSGASIPRSYTTLGDALASVAALATPTPESMASTPSNKSGAKTNWLTTFIAAFVALGVVALAGLVTYLYRKHRQMVETPASQAVESIVVPTTIYPENQLQYPTAPSAEVQDTQDSTFHPDQQ